MSSSLSRVPVAKRRQAAATLGLFATLFFAIGAVAATGARTGVLKAFVVVALLVAALLALTAWGVVRSISLDAAATADAAVEKHLDDAIEAAVLASGQNTCGCGHEHDPSVLHVPDDPCARDGHGEGCTHSCETCVLATLKRTAARPGARRPSPTPR